MNKKAIIIGGGAAGFFAAINLKEQAPDCEVSILEKSQKLLAKVRISGGGRCNVTHACFENSLLTGYYPRGSKALRGAFSRFNPGDTVEWFRQRGVELHTEADGRMFPESNQSETIVRCLMGEAERLGVKIRLGVDVQEIRKATGGFELFLNSGPSLTTDLLLIATGGNPKAEAYRWLENLGHTIVPPVPSLFTFNVPDAGLRELMGLSVPDALLRIEGLPLETNGPVLITHWGLSGPAVLKLSAWAARSLQERNYQFKLIVSWTGVRNIDELKADLVRFRQEWNTKVVFANPLFQLPKRLWEQLLLKAGIQPAQKWADLNNKNILTLAEKLGRDSITVQGKTTFKEEFVTCGGIALSEVDFRTMQSRICPGLYFAGEVLDIDGITGGFNFQSAWTTSWIAAQSMASV